MSRKNSKRQVPQASKCSRTTRRFWHALASGIRPLHEVVAEYAPDGVYIFPERR